MIKKIALITGASRGLGAALSERLSETHHIIAVAVSYTHLTLPTKA